MAGTERTADILKALAHPVRLQILQVLEQEGEACVCHLEAALDQRQAYISQQLAVLRAADLVIDRRDGLNVYYAPGLEGLEPLLSTARALASELGPSDRDGGVTDDGTLPRPTDCTCPRCGAEAKVPSPQG